MPCYDERDSDRSDSWEYRLQNKCDRATRVACDLINVMRRNGMYKDLSQETVEWICEHDRGEQVARIAEASREIDKAKQKARILEELRERAKAKLDALAKLTMDERRVLGLMDERRVLGL